MESGDIHLWLNRNWDPVYLASIFDADLMTFRNCGKVILLIVILLLL